MARVLTEREARKMSKARKTHAGATPVTRPCGWCGEPQTAREDRIHWSKCPKRPDQETTRHDDEY